MKKAEIQMALENPDQAYHTLKEAVKQEAVSEEVYENLGLMEKFYKADSTATRKVVEEYLKKGGRPSPQIRSLLQF